MLWEPLRRARVQLARVPRRPSELSVWASDRLRQHGLLHSPLCHFGGQTDTLEHRIDGGCSSGAAELPKDINTYFLNDVTVDDNERAARAAGFMHELCLEAPF